MYLIRKTYGYRKKVDYIANCQIVNDVHLCKSVVSRCLSVLESRKIVIRDGKNIGINKDWEQWKKLAELLPNQMVKS
jgi:phage replication O-like protein O